jgi:hypothetical protein
MAAATVVSQQAASPLVAAAALLLLVPMVSQTMLVVLAVLEQPTPIQDLRSPTQAAAADLHLVRAALVVLVVLAAAVLADLVSLVRLAQSTQAAAAVVLVLVRAAVLAARASSSSAIPTRYPSPHQRQAHRQSPPQAATESTNSPQPGASLSNGTLRAHQRQRCHERHCRIKQRLRQS